MIVLQFSTCFWFGSLQTSLLCMVGSKKSKLNALVIKIVRFGRQVADFVKKRHTNAIFGCSRFQKLKFYCLLHELLNCSPTTEHILNFACSLWTNSFFMISVTNIYVTFFFGLKS